MERLLSLMDMPAIESEVMYRLDFCDLRPVRMLQPEMSCPFIDHVTTLRDELKQQNENVLQKYDYMFEHVSFLFSKRFDYVYEGLELPITYELQYKTAMGWFQEMVFHFGSECRFDLYKFPTLAYLINTFIEKWCAFFPDEETDRDVLFKELVLSELAMRKMRGATPRGYHLDAMEKMEAYVIPPFLVLTHDEHMMEKDNEVRKVCHFNTFPNFF